MLLPAPSANQRTIERLLCELNAVSYSIFLTQAFLVKLDEFTNHLREVGAASRDLYPILTQVRQDVMTFLECLIREKERLEINLLESAAAEIAD